MAQKKPKLDRQTLLDRRYDYMKQAFKIDGGKSASPISKELETWARHWTAVHLLGTLAEEAHLGKFKIYDVHHIMGRTNTGEFDTLEYLITLNRLEHECVEGDCVIENLRGDEYMYLILYLLRKSTKNRWNKPRELIEKNISIERLEYIRKIK